MSCTGVAAAHILYCGAQRHAANVAAIAAHAAGATQRELARVRAAVDHTDIDATLAAATLSGSSADSVVQRAADAHAHHHTAKDGSRQMEVQRLFGDQKEHKYAAAARRAGAIADHTLDVEVRLIVEVRQRTGPFTAATCICAVKHEFLKRKCCGLPGRSVCNA